MTSNQSIAKFHRYDSRTSDLRDYQPQNAFAKRRRRLGLTNKQAAKWLGVPYKTALNWNQGRPAPRHAMRMLAAYRLIKWGKYQSETIYSGA